MKGALAVLLIVGLAGPAAARAPVTLDCTHVTKSTLRQTPLARPGFARGEVARLALLTGGTAEVAVRDARVAASWRICPRGAKRPCPDVRGISGDVVTFYRDITQTPGHSFAIWARKGASPQALIENVMLDCIPGDAVSQ